MTSKSNRERARSPKNRKNDGAFGNFRVLDIIFGILFVVMVFGIFKDRLPSLPVGKDAVLPSEILQAQADAQKKFPFHEDAVLISDAIGCYDENVMRHLIGIRDKSDVYEKAMLRRMIERKCVFLKAGDTVYIEDVIVWDRMVKVLPQGQTSHVWISQRVLE